MIVLRDNGAMNSWHVFRGASLGKLRIPTCTWAKERVQPPKTSKKMVLALKYTLGAATPTRSSKDG